MEFAEKICAELSRVDFGAVDKDDALRQIAALAASSPLLGGMSSATIYDKLKERELAVSTGIGDGIAIPHARFAELDDFLVFLLVSRKGVDFAALDKRRVQVFVVVLAPEAQVAEHLKMLAGVSRMFSQAAFKKELLASSTAAVLNEVVVRHARGGAEKTSASRQMKLLVIVLYYERDMHEILEFLIDQGIKGATIVASQGMGAYVSNLPLFASFLGFMREDRNVSNTILALIPTGDEQLIVRGVEGIVGDLDKSQGAMLMTLDLSFWKGTMNMI